jgi:mRNA interferase MazF
MMTIRPGEFWIADIPYTNARASKKRPVLVLWRDADDVVVAAVTTASPRSSTDGELIGWTKASLRKPSTVRLSRLDCLEKSLLIGRIGTITAADGKKVKEAWAQHVNPKF